MSPDDDVPTKAKRILTELARLSNKDGVRAYKLITNSFTEAVGMQWGEMRRVVPYVVQMGWATKPTGVSLLITPKGFAAAAAPQAPAAPPAHAFTAMLDLAFVTNAPLRAVLERNAVELQKAIGAEAWTSAIVHAGAIAEGVLIFGLTARAAKAAAARAVVAADPTRNKNGYKPKAAPEDWALWFLIEVADEMAMLKGTTKGLTHNVLREFRNMIHPYVQIRDNLTPDRTSALGSAHYLTSLVEDVRNAPP